MPEISTPQGAPAQIGRRLAKWLGWSLCAACVLAGGVWLWHSEPWLELSRGRAESLIRQKQYRQAAHVCERLLERTPRDPALLFTLARAQAGAGQLKQATQALRRIPEWSGRKDAALLFEGKLLLELRRGADAERAFLACVERENAGAPPAVSARLELFALYAMEERVEAFKRMFWSTFPMLGPEERLPALTMRMRIEFEQTKPELNAQLLRAYIQNDPADFQARAGLASALDHAGESTAARQQFDEAQRLAPNDVEIYVRLLDLASRQADQPAVGRLLEHRPPGSDNNAEVQKFVGQAALEKGDLSAAAAAFQRAAELRPDVPEHRHRLAQVLIRQGRREEAQVHATERNRLNQAREALRQAWNAFADAYESDPAHVSASLLDAVGRACIDARMEREGEAWLAEAGRLSSR